MQAGFSGIYARRQSPALQRGKGHGNIYSQRAASDGLSQGGYSVRRNPDGKNGFLSKQGDTDELVETLNRIEKEPKQKVEEIRKQAVLTAYGYRDSEIAKKYLNDVLVWKNG